MKGQGGRPAQRLSFLTHHRGDGLFVQAPRPVAGLPQHAHCLPRRQAEGGADRGVEQLGIGVLDLALEARVQLQEPGQGQLHVPDLALQLDGQLDDRSEQNHALQALVQYREQIP